MRSNIRYILQQQKDYFESKKKILPKVVESVAKEVYDSIKKNAPVGIEGDLKNSINVIQHTDLKYEIYSNNPTAYFVNEGTGIYRNDGVLTNEWCFYTDNQAIVDKYYPKAKKLGNGWLVYTQGQKPNPYWTTSVIKGRVYMEQLLLKLFRG